VTHHAIADNDNFLRHIPSLSLFIAPGFVVRIHRGDIPAAKHKSPSSGQVAGDPLFRNFDVFARKPKSEWLSKKRQMQGAQLSRNEAYSRYAAVTRAIAATQQLVSFCDAIKLFSANLPSIRCRSFDADQFGGDFSGEDRPLGPVKE
jgi:hypothetical protein